MAAGKRLNIKFILIALAVIGILVFFEMPENITGLYSLEGQRTTGTSLSAGNTGVSGSMFNQIFKKVIIQKLPENTEAACSDGWDNDVDGAIDCQDIGCNKQVCARAMCWPGTVGTGLAKTCVGGFCVQTITDCKESPLTCADAIDNDFDGVVDCADADCNMVGMPPCEFGKEISCRDNFDNDADTWKDGSDCDCNYVDLTPTGVSKTIIAGNYNYSISVKNLGTADAESKITMSLATSGHLFASCDVDRKPGDKPALKVGQSDSCTVSVNTSWSNITAISDFWHDCNKTNDVVPYDV